MFSYIPFRDIPINEMKWTCYMHACLKYVAGEHMTNTTLLERFGVLEENKALISRLITACVKDKLIKLADENTAPRYYRYVPFWA